MLRVFSHVLWICITFQVNFHRNTATTSSDMKYPGADQQNAEILYFSPDPGTCLILLFQTFRILHRS